MDFIENFFADTPLWFRVTMLLGGMLFFWLMEILAPLFRNEYKKLRHAGLNLFFTGTTALINLGLAGLLVGTALWVSTKGLGVIHVFKAPLWIKAVVGILLMDLIGAWLVHWVEHKVRFMWIFHLIHHTDTHVDVTTGLRHHPGESVFRMVFTILAIFIVGAPLWMVMVYQSLSALFTHFNHANIKLPRRLDIMLSYVFVTPDMHKVHHHFTQPYTDSNYGNIFSIWDRLFGTFKELQPETIKYGIDTHMNPEENDQLGNLLHIPFQKYRKPPGELNKEKNEKTK